MWESNYLHLRIFLTKLMESIYKIYRYADIYPTCATKGLKIMVFNTTFNNIPIISGCQYKNRICGVLVTMAILNTVDRRFEPQFDQIKDYKTGICYFLVE